MDVHSRGRVCAAGCLPRIHAAKCVRTPNKMQGDDLPKTAEGVIAVKSMVYFALRTVSRKVSMGISPIAPILSPSNEHE